MTRLFTIRFRLPRRLLMILFLGHFAMLVNAQSFNNEWINYDQTYFKFKVGKNGLYRIGKAVLDSWGLGGTPVENLELWRNGEKVYFYPSVGNGPLPADGYLEFWGVVNDGKPDQPLYRDPSYQHTAVNSLLQDSSTYFLSANANRNGSIITTAPNPVSQNVLPVEPYFLFSSGIYFKNKINPGFAAVIGEYVYSSSYDRGEFWSSDFIYPSGPLSSSISNLFANIDGPEATIRFGAAGCALNTRKVKAFINNTLLADLGMDYFDDLKDTISFPVSLLSSGTAAIRFNNSSNLSNDRMVVSFVELNYPRNFNFGGQQNFEFDLPEKQEGYYLEIVNFNYGTIPPVLYDLTNGKRYVAELLQGKLAFALPPSSLPVHYVLASQASGNILTIPGGLQRKFINYNEVAQQGNYLIISHPSLNVGTGGRKPIDEYRDYRNSALGGGYKAIAIDVNEINDQFAFGINKHPLTVRNFLRFARANFAQPLNHVFIIGRGMTYLEYRLHPGDSLAEKLNLVPTFGYPGSDNLLSSVNVNVSIPETSIGRLSVVAGAEIETYLEKVREYESVQRSAANTVSQRSWMKNLAQVTGASDPYLGTILCNYMGVYKDIAADTSWGANVSTFCKLSATNQDLQNSQLLKQKIEEGISALTYFGHSSATTLDFNIDNPQNYNNAGKYPVFFVNGCNAGNFFTYYPQRFIVNETLSEKFVLAKQRGSVAFVASTHFGIVNYLNIYLSSLYHDMGGKGYGSTLGQLNRIAIRDMLAATGQYDFYARTHSEQITLHGDPALRMSVQSKPDYVLEPQLVELSPAFISIAEEKFKVKVNIINLGKSIADSVRVEIKRQFPDGTTTTIFNARLPRINFKDSILVELPIAANRDKGSNKIIAVVDSDSRIDEMDENNNRAEKEFFIYEDEARPVYPYNYSIINVQGQKLYASTANPLAPQQNYVMEIDTSEGFSSPLRTSKTISSSGGVLEFDPGISYRDSTVYYWRISPVTSGGFRWNTSSFMYLAGGLEGFNQSHYFQFSRSVYDNIYLDSSSRQLKFRDKLNNLFIRNAVYPFGGRNDFDFSITVNSLTTIKSACVGNSLLFCVFDPFTFLPWKNVDNNGSNLYLYGSGSANCGPFRQNNFEFSYMTPESRKKIMNFMDTIPNGSYVVVRSIDANDPNAFSATWRGDTALFGSNNSLYHKLLAAGFMDVDSLNRRQCWAFVYKKKDNSFRPVYRFSDGLYDPIILNADCPTPDSVGRITSPRMGPALQWREVSWSGSSLESPSNDSVTIEVLGVKANNEETVLYTMNQSILKLDVSAVSALEYPYLKLRMRNQDARQLTPMQLKYWRIHYDPLPEGGLAPGINFSAKDTVEVGEPLPLAIVFKNISKVAFDSLKAKLVVVDKNNVSRSVPLSRFKPLVKGDTVLIRLNLDTKELAGTNTLFLDVNPDNDQPEEYHFNNFLYWKFYVKSDQLNPLLDVTFDGTHILNRDIVSASPHILITLKDEARYLLLNDSALLTVQVRYPDGSLRKIKYDNDTLRFTPALTGSDNTATIDFTPQFKQQFNPEGDEYELLVQGKDRSGNKAGNVEYKVVFQVIAKPMVSNLLNYPNPFSTSTAFVFTLTGSEIPEQFKIQILTITGRVVREITQEELGPIHIGRNITTYKWDGTDQFGQPLGNGVYLYRVVTKLNGKSLDKFTTQGDNTNQFFNNGYGKMYLMR